jgi:hypothetical protein
MKNVSDYVTFPYQVIQTEETYPNLDHDEDNCYANPQFGGAQFFKYTIESTEDYIQIKSNIYRKGPMLAEAQIGLEFMLYEGGIMDVLNTGFIGYQPVFVIGYGEELGVGYWIAKNSWGRDWGEHGYVRVKMAIKAGESDVLNL